MIHNHSKQQGFTLIEVVVALCIISSAVIALAPLQAQVPKKQQNLKNSSGALFLAEAKMEQLKSTDFASLTNGQDNNIDSLGQSNGIFNRVWTISDYAGTSDLKQIELLISWQDLSGSHQVILSTVVARRE